MTTIAIGNNAKSLLSLPEKLELTARCLTLKFRKWKESASERSKQSKRRRVGVSALAIMAAGSATFIYDEDPDDDDYVEEDEESYVEENGEDEPGEASSGDDTPLELHLPPQNTTRRRLRRRRRAGT